MARRRRRAAALREPSRDRLARLLASARSDVERCRDLNRSDCDAGSAIDDPAVVHPEVVLVRQGLTAWSRARRHTGRTDVPRASLLDGRRRQWGLRSRIGAFSPCSRARLGGRWRRVGSLASASWRSGGTSSWNRTTAPTRGGPPPRFAPSRRADRLGRRGARWRDCRAGRGSSRSVDRRGSWGARQRAPVRPRSRPAGVHRSLARTRAGGREVVRARSCEDQRVGVRARALRRSDVEQRG